MGILVLPLTPKNISWLIFKSENTVFLLIAMKKLGYPGAHSHGISMTMYFRMEIFLATGLLEKSLNSRKKLLVNFYQLKESIYPEEKVKK